MIRMEAPYLRIEEDQVFLCAPITINGEREIAWFSTETQYGNDLTVDRLDAFVVGFLTTAMRLGEDIICEAPITKRLHYQLSTLLIPSMVANMDCYHAITIHAPLTDTAIPCKNAVATGWTGGVDSMFTLMTHLNNPEPSRRLTHLLVANVGTLESKNNFETLRYMAAKAKNGIAREVNLQVIYIDSNIHLLQTERYIEVVPFRLPAAVLALQKLFSVFLTSSCIEFAKFEFSSDRGGYYELLPLSCFETDNTVIYSTGGHIPRIEKIRALLSFPLAHRYLHPCIYVKRENCGICGKCVRTMGALYAMGALERFRKVFDIEAFLARKDDHLADIVANGNGTHYKEILLEMKRQQLPIPDEVMRKVRIRRAAIRIVQKTQE